MKIVLVALSLIFATSSMAYANWKYHKSVDDFDGFVTHWVTFNNYSEEDAFSAYIQCRDDKFHARDINFSIKNVIDSFSENRIRVKFDDEKPEWLHVNYSDGGQWDTLYTKSITSFKTLTDKMQKHSTMKVEIYLFRQGKRITPIFLTGAWGFTEAFNKLPSYCQ